MGFIGRWGRPGGVVQQYSISGKVTDDAAANVAGATITATGDLSAQQTTAADGTYTFANVNDASSVTLTPTKSGIASFSPTNRAVVLAGANATGKDFVGTRTTYSLSGTILDGSSAPIASVTVTLTGDVSSSTTTDASGNYTFTGLHDGNALTVTPTKAGLSFTPTSSSLTISGASATRNFTGAGTAAYDPANYFTTPTKIAWWPYSDSSKLLDVSDAAAADGANVKTVTDGWGNGRSLVQSTGADQAVCKKNSVNTSLSSLEYAAVDGQGYIPSSFLAQLDGASSAVIGMVFSLVDGASNADLFFCYDHSYSYTRLRPYMLGLKAAGHWNVLDGSDEGNEIDSTNSNQISAGNTTYHAGLWIFDFANKKLNVYMDNAHWITDFLHGTAQNMVNTDMNEPHALRNFKGRAVDQFMVKNAIPSAGQITSWFADVKSKFGLAGY